MQSGFSLRYAFRTLRRSPGFASAAILSLALGIAANAAIFSIINGLLLHPAGIERPEQVVAPRVSYKKLNLERIEMSATDFADVRKSGAVFSSAAMATTRGFNYTGGATPERVQAAAVTWQWFDVFGAKPAIGRQFRPEDDQPGANQVVILSANAWAHLFGSDSGVVGRSIELNQKPYRIVGVMPKSFLWPAQADIWVPMGLPPEAYAPQNRFNESYMAVARLRAGVTLPAAAKYMDVLTQQAKNSDGGLAAYARDSEWSMNVEPWTELVSGDYKKPMFILLAAVGFVLLIACSNIAGLMLVRATGRARELAIRTSLGASRSHLVRQAFAESILIGAAATALGIAFASLLLQLILRLTPERMASGAIVHMDNYVLLFTAGIGLLAAVLFGLAPAWQMSRLGQSYARLKEGGRSDTEGTHRQRLRAALVTAQVALALVLLFGAGLFLKSLSKLREVDTGFHSHGVMTASIALPEAQYGDETKQAAFFRAVLANLSQAPGVQAAAVIDTLPFSGNESSASFTIEGRAAAPGDPGPHGGIRAISANYFEALRIRLLKGRFFTEADRAGSQPVAIIDENLARQYWPNQDPIGQRLRNGSKDAWSTIVGVVGHVKHTQLAADSGKGVYYYTMAQKPSPFAFVAVSGTIPLAQLGGAIRQAVQSVDPSEAVFDLKSMDQRIEIALGPQQFAVVLLTMFAAAALILAALGLYGVISYTVTQRTRELGIRAALGASRSEVLGMVVAQGMRLVAIGGVFGLVAALILSQLIASQLFQVSVFDPATFAETAAVLAATALLAAFIPAWRATRIDPMVALRYE